MTYTHVKALQEDRNRPAGGPATEACLQAAASLPVSSPLEKLHHLLESQREHPGDRRLTTMIGGLLVGAHSPAVILSASQHYWAISNNKPSTETGREAYKTVVADLLS